MSDLTAAIEKSARELGFSVVGFAPARPSADLAHYFRWLRAGMHGTMDYMARPDRMARRKDLDLILPGAQSLIVVAQDYYTGSLPPEIAADQSRGRISNYAWGADYHRQMLPRLNRLAAVIDQLASGSAFRSFVDTGPILERSHATAAGLGFIGKNTMLIHPRRGSYFFLGEIITTLKLDYNGYPGLSQIGCGTCSRCLAACPTGAFLKPYVLDSRKCISYLTIEHKKFIPKELRTAMGNWVYGCDVCQDVCPWQRFAPRTHESGQAPIDLDRAAPPLIDLLKLTDQSFHARFQGTAIVRIRRERLVRNACIAAGNSSRPELGQHLILLLRDISPLVRGHAAWALGQLGLGSSELSRALEQEKDVEVRQEMEEALELLRG